MLRLQQQQQQQVLLRQRWHPRALPCSIHPPWGVVVLLLPVLELHKLQPSHHLLNNKDIMIKHIINQVLTRVMIKDTNNHQPSKDMIKDTNNHLPNKDMIKDSNSHLPNKDMIKDTNSHLPNKDMIKDTNNSMPSKGMIKDTNNHLPSRDMTSNPMLGIQSNQPVRHISTSLLLQRPCSFHHPRFPV
jgi:uncharacterized protein (UPF0216 family)